MAKQNASESFLEATDHDIVSNRRINSISGGPFINKHKDHDFCSELFHSDKINAARDIHCSVKYFFDFNTNNTTAASEFQGSRKNSDTSS